MGSDGDMPRAKGFSSNAVRSNFKLIEDFKTIKDQESYSPSLSKIEGSDSGTDGLKNSKEILDEDSEFSLGSREVSELKSYHKKNFRMATKRESTEHSEHLATDISVMSAYVQAF